MGDFNVPWIFLAKMFGRFTFSDKSMACIRVHSGYGINI